MTPSTLPTSATGAPVAAANDTAPVTNAAQTLESAAAKQHEEQATPSAEPAPKFATLPGLGVVGETCGIDGC